MEVLKERKKLKQKGKMTMNRGMMATAKEGMMMKLQMMIALISEEKTLKSICLT